MKKEKQYDTWANVEKNTNSLGTIQRERVFVLKDGEIKVGPVVYWMSRDQRAEDNWALIYAQNLAIDLKQPLLVVFCLVDNFLNAPFRHYDFMLKGLQFVSLELKKKNIHFILLKGDPKHEILKLIHNYKASVLISDFDPLKIKRKWKDYLIKNINIPFHEVDAHNIVPVRYVSQKLEYSAHTIRPKIMKNLGKFLILFPPLVNHPYSLDFPVKTITIEEAIKSLNVDKSVGPVTWIKPGTEEGKGVLRDFIKNKLKYYERFRNDPTIEAQSNLSVYLHFGQISAQSVALELLKANTENQSKSKYVFLEQLIVRRELAENFCYYNEKYDSFEGFPLWAKQTLLKHQKDVRPYIYSLRELENAETHDNLWNAAQMEMVKRGKTHGFMRMYWAKNILKWTKDPEDALEIAIYLNDKYEIDGRDPNGYTGIAWSIGGVHDRPWPERPIFGKIRYMSYKGCINKFDVNKYIDKISKY